MIAEDLKSNELDTPKLVALLRRAGFECDDVAAAIKGERKALARGLLDAKCEPIQVASALEGAGVSRGEIAALFKELGVDRVFVARALKTLEASASEIASSMRRTGYSADDIAVAMRLTGYSAAETTKAMTAAKFGKDEIPKALAYAGYKPGGEEPAAKAADAPAKLEAGHSSPGQPSAMR
jgi:hypothetical protein